MLYLLLEFIPVVAQCFLGAVHRLFGAAQRIAGGLARFGSGAGKALALAVQLAAQLLLAVGEAFLERLSTFPDAGLGAMEKRQEFRRRVAEEQRLLSLARREFGHPVLWQRSLDQIRDMLATVAQRPQAIGHL